MMQLSQAIGTAKGNLLDVVYDATALEMWVAYAKKNECAYRRPFTRVRMKDYLDFTKRPAGAAFFEGRDTS